MANGNGRRLSRSQRGALLEVLADPAQKRRLAMQGSFPPISRSQQGILTERASNFDPRTMPGYKKGGKVKKTGPAKLHKGEVVLPAKTAKRATPKRRTRR